MNLETLLDQWAAKVDVHTVLERIVGRATAPVCAAFAASGKAIVTVVDPDASTERVRAVYGLKADVRVAGNDDVELPKSDLVLVHGERPDWRLALGAARAGEARRRRSMIVVVDNPAAWPAQARSLVAMVMGARVTGANAASTNERRERARCVGADAASSRRFSGRSGASASTPSSTCRRSAAFAAKSSRRASRRGTPS